MKLLRPLFSGSAVCAALCGMLAAQEPRLSSPAKPPQTKPARPNFFGLAPPPDPAAVERGQARFVSNCGFCHGSEAKGGSSGPDLIRSVLVLHDEGSGKEIGPVILNGRPGKGMPKFDMTEPQIKDIAAFLLSLSQAAVNRGDYKILNVVTGNASAGKAYFESHCAECHSSTGDLAGIAAKYDPVALQSRFLYPESRRNAEAAKTARSTPTVTVTLPDGSAVSGTLVHVDDFNVSLRDSSGAYRSFLLGSDGVKIKVRDPLKGHQDLLGEYSDADMHNILAYLETLK